MARIARPSVLVQEPLGLCVGMTTRPGSSSLLDSSLGLSGTVSGRRPSYLEREEYDHFCHMLQFIAAFEPHPAFAVGVLQHLWRWYYRNRNTPEQAAHDFFVHVRRELESNAGYLDALAIAYYDLHPTELKYLSDLERRHKRMLDESVKIFTKKQGK